MSMNDGLALPSRCSSCDAEIRWAISTASGKLMPVDALPAKGIVGNILLTERNGQLWATVLSKAAALSAPKERHVSHFATCPNSASHRKEKP